MEVLNISAAAAPLSAILQAATTTETKNAHNIKASTKRTSPSSPSASNHTENALRRIGSQLKNSPINAYPTIILSALYNPARTASALTYEEALQQGVSSSPTEAAAESDLGLNGVTDAVLSFATENSVAIIAGVVLVGLPLVLTRILSNPQTWGTVSAEDAYSKLGDDPEAQLVDIRTLEDIKEVGSPDIRSLKKRVTQIVYEDDESFLQRVSAKFKDPDSTTLYILDKFDGNSERVAKLVAENGFQSAFAIKDGAEGTKGWQSTGLPWLIPKNVFTVDFGNLKEALDSALEDTSGLVPVTVGVAAATGFGIAAFSEIETVLQLLGSAALIQVFVKKLLFAEDRKKTLQQIQDFLDTKVASKELVDELKDIGKALLPKTVDVATNNGAVVPSTEQANDSVTPVPAPVSISSGTEIGDNSTPQPVPVKNETIVSNVAVTSTPSPRYLSPYPHYPDFKPPTSPCPSRP